MRTRAGRGFTLIELMVTLSVVAVLMAIAAPGFGDSLRRARIKAQVGDIVNLMELARTEAIKRNQVTTTIAYANNGIDWRVTTEWQQPDGSLMARSTTGSGQIALLAPAVPGATTLSTAATITGSFRGVFTGYVSSNSCKDGDQCLHLRSTAASPGGSYTLRVGISAIGQVVACSVGESIGGYPAC